MEAKHVCVLLAVALAAVLIWRATPAHSAPADTLADAALGQNTVVPVLPPEAIVGMSYGLDDGDDGGPYWYTIQYPGVKPRMPAQPSAVKV